LILVFEHEIKPLKGLEISTISSPQSFNFNPVMKPGINFAQKLLELIS